MQTLVGILERAIQSHKPFKDFEELERIIYLDQIGDGMDLLVVGRSYFEILNNIGEVDIHLGEKNDRCMEKTGHIHIFSGEMQTLVIHSPYSFESESAVYQILKYNIFPKNLRQGVYRFRLPLEEIKLGYRVKFSLNFLQEQTEEPPMQDFVNGRYILDIFGKEKNGIVLMPSIRLPFQDVTYLSEGLDLIITSQEGNFRKFIINEDGCVWLGSYKEIVKLGCPPYAATVAPKTLH
ncbi:hypothetical protein HYS31_01320 [Candidatus Woesearchaeota archaeon]|nr:hypothetical protein [Candidatus Woesearchaeota archaeon]